MGLTLPLASTPFITVQPLNIDDIDLTKEPLEEKPVWKLTNTTSLLLRWVLAETFRGLMLLPADMGAYEKHGHVMSVDRKLRQWLAVSLFACYLTMNHTLMIMLLLRVHPRILCQAMRATMEAISYKFVSSQRRAYLSFKTLTILAGRQWAFLADIHGELLHIHRPYMVCMFL